MQYPIVTREGTSTTIFVDTLDGSVSKSLFYLFPNLNSNNQRSTKLLLNQASGCNDKGVTVPVGTQIGGCICTESGWKCG